MIDTLKELFENNRPLFEGLTAEPLWDWGTRYPVIRISRGAGMLHSRAELDDVLDGQLLGLDIRLEDTTNQGRIDMVVLFESQVFLFEFKGIELTPEGGALQQVKDKGYADKYRARGEPVHLIGMEFSKASRNIVGFEVETL